MMDSNSDLLRTGAGNLARLRLTVCDLLHYQKRSMTGGGTDAKYRGAPAMSADWGEADLCERSDWAVNRREFITLLGSGGLQRARSSRRRR